MMARYLVLGSVTVEQKEILLYDIVNFPHYRDFSLS